jgi:4-hydroxysphinganine ceramide fatty acyl 2-hydroxylase
MATGLTFKSQEEFQKYSAEHDDRALVTYKGIVYDVTEFLDDHPGGPAFILEFKGKDITEIFFDDDYHEHSDNALRMLYKYKVGKIEAEDDKQNQKAEEGESYPKISKDKIEYNDFNIDLTRGMVPQVLNLNKKQYMHMTHYPVHLPYCRLFDSDFTESLSRNPWYRILILWLPLVAYLLYNGVTFDYEEHSSFDKYLFAGSADFSVLAVALTFFLGVFFWTLMEYSLHRGVFHFDDYLPDHPYALYLHFLIHGIHHVIPMDPDRLVFPPVLGVIVYSLLFPPVISLIPGNMGRIFVAGVAIGYICYDMTHIYIHHCTPWIGHLKEMKKYHNKHHYVDGNKGYGITSKIWDKVFKTELL